VWRYLVEEEDSEIIVEEAQDM
jgi:WD40 repeat protein